MNELLQALTDAARVGFDAPKCNECWPCKSCDSTGLDTFSGQCIRCGGTRKAHTPGIDRHGMRIIVPVTGVDPECKHCHATGLDASDPYGLVGRAMVWLWARDRNVTDAEYPNISAAVRDAETGCGMRGLKLAGDHKFERHDGTPTGLATALLRLVARVGTPHPQIAPETRETETA